MEKFNLELKKLEDYLNNLVANKTLNDIDNQNIQIHLDNINNIVKGLIVNKPSNNINCEHPIEYTEDATYGDWYYCHKCNTYFK